MSKQLPAGVTQEQAVAALRAQGQDNLANMLAGMSNINPGQGVDFAAVGQVLLVVTAIYLLSALFGWLQGYIMAGVVARDDLRAAPGRRSEARPSAAQVLRQPPAGRHPQPGDERHRQHPADDAADAHADHHVDPDTLIGVLAMMFWISPLLAVICLVTVPISVVITMLIAKRSQKQFALQWEHTGRPHRARGGDASPATPS